MKTKITKLVLLLLAVLTTGSVNAATETYDFTAVEVAEADIVGGRYALFTWGDNVADDMQMMAYGTETFDGRFSAGPRAQNAGANANCFKLRVDAGDWKGLYSQYADRVFAIRDLKVGDKVTITMKAERENLQFKTGTTDGQTYAAVEGVTGGAAVVSGTEYTVTAAGNLLFVTTGETIIQKIVIETPSTSVPVTISVIPDAATEEYDFQALGKAQESENTFDVTFGTEVLKSPASIMLFSFGGDDFNNRFAGNRDWAIRKHSNATYCALYNKNGYSGRYLAICDLKAGDKVTIKFFCDADQSLIFQNAIVDGVSAGNAVVSDQEYTVKTDGALILDEGANTSGKRVYIYKVTIEPASSSTGTYTGATLVSNKALDFTNVDEVTAYVATAASAGSVTFTKVTKVAANTPLYIKANAENGATLNVEIPELEGDAEAISTNLLKGSATTSTSVESDATTKYYVYGVQSGVAGFYNAASAFESAAGKAYLQLTAAQAAAAARINMEFDDNNDMTGINTVKGSGLKVQGSDIYYNLAGQRVVQPTRGFYIVNGKKVIIKK